MSNIATTLGSLDQTASVWLPLLLDATIKAAVLIVLATLFSACIRRLAASQWIKEGKNVVKWTKLSCGRFKDNQTRLQLFALAYNLASFLRRLALPPSIKH